MRLFSTSLLALFGMSCTPSLADVTASTLPVMEGAEAGEHPNILLIVTDQQSYNAVSALATGNKSFCQTPNIDRLVKKGISFTQTYCANPVSVASRFSLFTGMYGGQYGVRNNLCPAADEAAIREMLQVNGMGNVFRQGGYETVYGGKVHLPFAGESGSKFTAPASYGFDTYLTKDEREELGHITASFIKNRKAEDKPMLLVASFLNPHDICLEGSTNLSSEIKGNKPEKTETVRMLRERVAAIDSIHFYRNLAPQLPSNFARTLGYPDTKCLRKRFLDLPDWYWRKYRWTYAELVKMVDDSIGEILDALDANPELKRNTVVVFTSDHGEMQGAHQTMGKSMPYDECQRVPLIFSGANVRSGGMTKDIPVCNGVDLLPTLCELAGISLPGRMDGVSLAPSIGKTKRTTEAKRDYIYMESETFVSIVKGNYKYILFDGDGNREMLFLKDSGEAKNIIGEHPAEASELRSIAQSHVGKLPVTVLKKAKNAGKVTGQEKKNKMKKNK